MKIKVLYYAALRDFTQKKEETLEVENFTAEQLFDYVKKKYNIPVDSKDLKVAINESYEQWETPLKDKDTVVFISPVAGG